MARRPFLPVEKESPFPLSNLPYGAFRRQGEGKEAERGGERLCVALGCHVVDLKALSEAGLLRGKKLAEGECFCQGSLNRFLAMGKEAWREARSVLMHLLDEDTPTLRDNVTLRKEAIHLQSEVCLSLPLQIGNYTDFYSSLSHATHIGSLFRDPAHPLTPNWRHLPVGYHGRASSIVLGGTSIRRPRGQVMEKGASSPSFKVSEKIDFELEMAAVVGPGNELGKPIGVDEAWDHIFGFVLLNDWSARDIQQFEYVPLGPFLSKSFASSISPWVVTVEALEPFISQPPSQDPEPLPYLREKIRFTFDIQLEVAIRPSSCEKTFTICKANFQTLYWTVAQQVAHHTVSGCNLCPGDLLASGTISGEEEATQGCLLELTRGGAEPLKMEGGLHERRYLEDGDEVIITGYCKGRDGQESIGFGTCSGVLLPSLPIEEI